MTIPVADLSFDRMPPHIDGTFTPMHRREGVLKRMVEVIAGGEKNDFGLGNHRNMLGEFDKSSQGLEGSQIRQQR
jgi:hypothetical protein